MLFDPVSFFKVNFVIWPDFGPKLVFFKIWKHQVSNIGGKCTAGLLKFFCAKVLGNSKKGKNICFLANYLKFFNFLKLHKTSARVIEKYCSFYILIGWFNLSPFMVFFFLFLILVKLFSLLYSYTFFKQSEKNLPSFVKVWAKRYIT